MYTFKFNSGQLWRKLSWHVQYIYNNKVFVHIVPHFGTMVFFEIPCKYNKYGTCSVPWYCNLLCKSFLYQKSVYWFTETSLLPIQMSYFCFKEPQFKHTALSPQLVNLYWILLCILTSTGVVLTITMYGIWLNNNRVSSHGLPILVNTWMLLRCLFVKYWDFAENTKLSYAFHSAM